MFKPAGAVLNPFDCPCPRKNEAKGSNDASDPGSIGFEMWRRDLTVLRRLCAPRLARTRELFMCTFTC